MENQPSGRSFETLISISDSEDSGSDSSERADALTYVLANSSVENFEADINKLKRDSSAKFKKRWEQIIERYSEINDDLESDEIDLRTGKITVDNGHLRSLASEEQMINGVKLHSSIWRGDYDYDKMVKEENRMKTLEQNAKRRMREKLKREDRFHNSSPLNTDSDNLSDNVLLLDLSPTKKLTISPLKRKASLPAGYISPVKRNLVDSQSWLCSPKRPISSPRHISRSSSYLSRGSSHLSRSPGRNSRSPGHNSRSPGQNSRSPSHISRSPRRIRNPSFADILQLKPRKLHFDAPDTNHDELYSIGSDLTDDIQVSLYTCAFSQCRFSSELKETYRNHLLLNHSPELNRIGYPVTLDSRFPDDMIIPEMTILKLSLHFPLQMDISSEKLLICNRQLTNGKCTKSFLSTKKLVSHHENPNQCSSRRQVLLCPILGCDFMTDGGGEEWRDHVNSHGSNSHGSKSHGSKPEITSDLMPSKLANIGTGVMESVEDIFSDSVSSLEFSDDEETKMRDMDDFWTSKPTNMDRFQFEIVTSDEE